MNVFPRIYQYAKYYQQSHETLRNPALHFWYELQVMNYINMFPCEKFTLVMTNWQYFIILWWTPVVDVWAVCWFVYMEISIPALPCGLKLKGLLSLL